MNNMKKIEITLPIFKQVQVDEIIKTKWVTEDGKEFDTEEYAENWEFYNCKLNQRYVHFSVDNLKIFDFASKEDLVRYELDYMYNPHIKKYDKDKMNFPATYVMFERYEETKNEEENEWEDFRPDTLVYLMEIKEYKKMLIKEAEEIK